MKIIDVQTEGRSSLIDITGLVNEEVRKAGVDKGICYIFIPHTTAGVTINEAADPDVRKDLGTVLEKLVPWNDSYRHLEGNSAAHVKATLTGSSEMVLIHQGRLALGTWQGIFFCEFDGPRNRQIWVKVVPG
ncbi:MAG TPA: secondary thiamine-phosphate synthase enzyme YjbQ [Synergistales bacterium]|nr:secondary thiamine-phosphate synthase enzyme YjbQ [Synergistales bacterium]